MRIPVQAFDLGGAVPVGDGGDGGDGGSPVPPQPARSSSTAAAKAGSAVFERTVRRPRRAGRRVTARRPT